MENEKKSGPTTSLMGADGKVPDSKYSDKNYLSGLGGILLIVIVVMAVVAGIAHMLGWR